MWIIKGTGSSGLKHAGVSAIIAKSFARIFYRNAINVGLPVITADVEADKGDIMSVDLEKGIIENMSTGKKFEIKPFDQFMLGHSKRWRTCKTSP